MPPARRTQPKGAKSAATDSGLPEAGLPEIEGEMPFERAIEQLEGVVETLEDGELDLEAALTAFEQGVALSKHCAGQLDSAERRIEVLVEQGGELLTRPFEASEDGEDEGPN